MFSSRQHGESIAARWDLIGNSRDVRNNVNIASSRPRLRLLGSRMSDENSTRVLDDNKRSQLEATKHWRGEPVKGHKNQSFELAFNWTISKSQR